MKTRFIQHWLRIAALLLTVLTGGINATAQEIEGGEAFYVYQNDGHFDGFFYDQVKEIRYSRFDTLGIERSEYVSQEIVTEDSVYRFMLTAIDSVSYTQPEIRFAKGVRFMRDEGLMAYYDSMTKTDDGFVLYFSGALPAALQPKKGEVLQCPDLPDYDEVFVGKVKTVRNEGGKTVVECGYVDDIHDVFDQFVTVEQVRNVPTADGSRMSRRMAGLQGPRRVEGNYSDITLFNLNFAKEWSGFELGPNVTCGFALNLGFGVQATAVYKITWDEFYIKTVLKDQVSLGASLTVDGELYKKVSLKTLPGVGALINRFGKVPFPANFPILYANIMPEPFTDVQAHLTLTLNVGGEVKGTAFMLELKDKWPYVDMGINFVAPFLPYELEKEGKFSVNAQLNGSVYTGMKFPIKVGTEEWIKKLCGLETGVEVSAGPKLSGALDFDLLKIPFGAYEALKDSKVELTLMSIVTEASGEVELFGKKGEKKLSKTWNFGTYPFNLFAGIDNMECTVTGDNEDALDCSFDVSGDVCLPQKLGVGLYVKEDDDDIYYKKLYLWKTRDELYFMNTFNKVEVSFTDLPAGEYRVRPIVNLFGNIPVMKQEKVAVIASRDMLLKPEEAFFEEEGGEMDVTLVTKLAMPITAESDQDWIKTEITLPDGKGGYGKMHVKVAENNTDAYRTGTITVRQRYSPTLMSEKTFTVKQYGGLELSPSTLNFDKAGATKQVQILTSMNPITINLKGNDDWLEYDLDDRTLTITAKENPGPTRTATVVVSAWNPKYNGINAKDLTIRQEGTVDASLEPSSLNFLAEGGTQQVSVKLGDGTSFNGVSISDDDKDWLIVEKGKDYFNVTAMPNTTTQQRQGVVYCEVTRTATGKKGQLTLKVTQEFGNASVTPNSLSFDAEGGSQKVKINTGNYPYCGVFVGDDGTGWTEAFANSDGMVTITVGANPVAERRECTVVCWVSGVKNPADDDLMQLPVKIVQEPSSALQPVTPDGDDSPFESILFWTTRKINYVSSDNSSGNSDVVLEFNQTFNFKPENSHFTVNYGNTQNHYECKGYIEDSKTRQAATLSFDIDKRDNKVKNLSFITNTESLLEISMMGYTAHSKDYVTTSMRLGDFDLKTNGGNYKESKVSVAEGLRFITFSSVLDSRTTFTSTLYPDDLPEPMHESATYVPTNDQGDFVWLIVTYKDGRGEPIDLEWPSNAVMSSLKSDGMPVYEGSTPPTISGTYSLSNPRFVSDLTGASGAVEGMDNIILRFSGQKDGHITVDTYYIFNDGTSTADGELQGLIIGSGNMFSICVPDGAGGATILSGELSGSTINNLYYAHCSMNTVGEHVIIKDGDGTSSKTTWSPGSYDDARRQAYRVKKQ